jgi:hypothetical protein
MSIANQSSKSRGRSIYDRIKEKIEVKSAIEVEETERARDLVKYELKTPNEFEDLEAFLSVKVEKAEYKINYWKGWSQIVIGVIVALSTFLILFLYRFVDPSTTINIDNTIYWSSNTRSYNAVFSLGIVFSVLALLFSLMSGFLFFLCCDCCYSCDWFEICKIYRDYPYNKELYLILKTINKATLFSGFVAPPNSIMPTSKVESPIAPQEWVNATSSNPIAVPSRNDSNVSMGFNTEPLSTQHQHQKPSATAIVSNTPP